MAKIKFQLVTGVDHGTASADFRGDKFIGHEQGDEHKTLFQLKTEDEAVIQEALTVAPGMNAFLSKLIPHANAVDLLGGKDAFLRIGVFDDK